MVKRQSAKSGSKTSQSTGKKAPVTPQPTQVNVSEVSKPVIFCHIPKCGGSSLRESVRAAVGDGLISAYSGEDVQNFNAAPLKNLRGKAALIGHFPFPVHPGFMSKVTYFTVLRDPVDRIISMLNYHRWNKTAPNRAIVENLNDRDALTALLHPSLSHYNAITRFFGRGNDPFAAYQVAMQYFAHIGHVEEIDKTFQWLHSMGLSSGQPLKVNASAEKSKADITYKDRAFIRSHIYDDLRLHDMLLNASSQL